MITKKIVTNERVNFGKNDRLLENFSGGGHNGGSRNIEYTIRVEGTVIHC